MFKKFSFLFSVAIAVAVQAQVPAPQLDQLIDNTLKTFDVPGISVGVVKDGQLIYAKGRGVRSLKNNRPMDENTLVGIASNSKGFTATALAMLVDEGKLKWDDKVTKFIPEFKMYDPYVSAEITVEDLITHRAGLGLGQGDLMFFPEGGTLTVNDIVHNVRYLKPDHGFRSKLEYNNVMFIVAGEVIHRISGQTWAEFIENRILRPVGMMASYGSYNRAKASQNIIDAHAPVDGKAVAVPHDWNETANAAGGIMSNITDMAKWATFLMNGFVTADGKRLVSERNAHYLWQMHMPSTVAANNPYDTNFYGYGLGWFVSDVKGHRQIQHTGGLIGTVTQFTLIPDLKLGIIVLTNQQSGAAFNTITNTVKDSYLGIPDRNWLKTYGDRMAKYDSEVAARKKEVFDKVKAAERTRVAPAVTRVAGIYNDPWFGDVEIIQQGKNMRFISKTSPRLKGDLLPYSDNTFVVKWDDRSYDADSFVIFSFDENGKAESIQMKHISSVTDFSFDFSDLDLRRKK